MSIFVFGASDDLIEFRGDLYEETSADCDKDTFIGFDTGVILRMRYDAGGCWRLSVVVGADKCRRVAEGVEDGVGPGEHLGLPFKNAPSYSDVFEVPGATIAMVGTEVLKGKR